MILYPVLFKIKVHSTLHAVQVSSVPIHGGGPSTSPCPRDDRKLEFVHAVFYSPCYVLSALLSCCSLQDPGHKTSGPSCLCGDGYTMPVLSCSASETGHIKGLVSFALGFWPSCHAVLSSQVYWVRAEVGEEVERSRTPWLFPHGWAPAMKCLHLTW